jgi:rhodanese-related sulfurtransferase
MSPALPTLHPRAVRHLLLQGGEIALVDVREEDPFAQAHPLFAVQIVGRAHRARRALAAAAARCPIAVLRRRRRPGRRRRALAAGAGLHGGCTCWTAACTAGATAAASCSATSTCPARPFGELVEHDAGTPSLPADEVKALLDAGADVVVLDARRFDEYQHDEHPAGHQRARGRAGAAVRDLAPDPATRVIVNCAGRTRSLIGAQSLVNAGIPNPVAALRNGTIGWLLAGFTLDHGQQRRFGAVSDGQSGGWRAPRRRRWPTAPVRCA